MKISKNNAEHYIWGQLCDGWHLVQSEDLSVIHEKMPPGTSEVRHFHSKSKQFFFVLSGRAEIEVSGETVLLNTHEGVEIPPHVPHQMKNTSNNDTEFLVLSTPPGHGDRETAE